MEHKILKMHLATWRKLRGLVPGRPNETVDSYFRRIVRGVDNEYNDKQY